MHARIMLDAKPIDTYFDISDVNHPPTPPHTHTHTYGLHVDQTYITEACFLHYHLNMTPVEYRQTV